MLDSRGSLHNSLPLHPAGTIMMPPMGWLFQDCKLCWNQPSLGRPCHSLLLTLGRSLLSFSFLNIEIMPEPRLGSQNQEQGCDQEKMQKPQVMTREGSQDGDFSNLN